MVKLNIIGSILVFLTLSAFFVYQSQSSETNNTERTQTSLHQNVLQSPQTEAFEQLKKQFEEIQLKNTQLQEENLTLTQQKTELQAEKTKLEESKTQIELANAKMTEELTEIREARNQRRRRDPNSNSPYRVSSDESNNENRRRDRGGPQRFREMMSLRNISKISTLTDQQKEFFEALREDFKEFQIKMIREGDKLSREESEVAWGEQMKAYRENVFSNLTQEQVDELNKITEEQIQSFGRERGE